MEPTQEIRHGDCADVLQDMDDNSVHAVVTDPPYNFDKRFGDWDEIGSPDDYQEWCREWSEECRRILKPGGHLIAFSGSRTYGWLMCGVHDGGLEVKDTVTWHHGQGFPSGRSISSYIDQCYDGDDSEERSAEWAGWLPALKPATEFAVVARKPLEKSIYRNVLEHGTGALNIDSCRSDADRYPANLCLDPVVAELLDEQSGECGGQTGTKQKSEGAHEWEPNRDNMPEGGYGDSGGASRFFYIAKPSPGEKTINRQVENDHTTVKPLELMEWLVTLVTAEGQRVVDPFAGTGTTIMACKRLGRSGIGIEIDEGYVDIARKRVALAHEVATDFGDTPSEGTADNGQPGLDAFADGGAE